MISEEQLRVYTKPASDSEELQCDRSTRMIRAAMEEFQGLKGRRYKIIPQGSYPNNTNARRNSDVDICVVMEDVFIPNYQNAKGETGESYGFSDSDKNYADDRDTIRRALVQKFGSASLTAGKKAFDIHSVSGSRVDADVVPAWRFRAFQGRDYQGLPISRDGIIFWTTDGKQIINFPEQHLANGVYKNNATNGYFKSSTRILKHVRYLMLEEEDPTADGVSSFLLECMLSNIDDRLFFSSQTWHGRMQNLLHYLHEALKSGSAEQNWTEVSGYKWLFKPTYDIDANWTSDQAQAFVLAVYNRVIR